MTTALDQETDEALVALLAASALEESEARRDADYDEEDDQERINRAIRGGWAARDELLLRGPEAAMKVRSLFKHPDTWVRLRAAAVVIFIAPDIVRPIFQNIEDWEVSLERVTAREMLRAVERGCFSPH